MSQSGAEPVLRLAIQFLDLSRDVDRNIDDSLFRDEGGEIAYVFDANIFEVFMRPFDPRGQATSLHADDWKGGGLPIGWARKRSLAAQTALLTTEFLLSGDLPGQRGGTIYLSEWHSWEFARRVRELVKDQGKALHKQPTASPIETLIRILAPKLGGGTLEDQLQRIRQGDEILAADLADIQVRQPFEEGDWRAFISNREVLEVLANDSMLEPIEQLTRLLSAPVRRRLRPLHKDFVPSPSSLHAILDDARHWMDRLVYECGLRGIKIADEHSRADESARRRGALWDDARTLALVRWAAVNRTNPGQRMVLVTADGLMFDAYRRWYAELDPRMPEYAEPFFLRRLLQYAPIFNLADARNSLGEDVRAFFGQLQNIIEVTLLPINLARQGRSEGQQGGATPMSPARQSRADAQQAAITRMREKTALRLLDKEPISADLAYHPLCDAVEREGVGYHGGRLDRLLDEWRRLERTTMGVADDYVKLRLTEREKGLPGLFVGEVSQHAITNYIETLISELYEGSLALWLPLARDVVLEWKPGPEGGRSRAPIAFRLYLDDEQTIDLGQAVDDRLTGADATPLMNAISWESLRSRPQALFGLAACLALASEDWSNADHFAEMALRERPGGGDEDRQNRASDNEMYELRYLNALTRRFRMGVIGPARNADALTRIRRAAREAAELLGSCIEYHSRCEDGRRQTLRLIRTLSERAALHLFHAAALIRPVRTAPVPPGGKSGGARYERHEAGFSAEVATELRQEAANALDLAQHDLIECFDLAGRLEIKEEDRNRFLRRVEQQYSINTAATCVLRNLMNPDDPRPWGGFPDALLDKLAQDIRERRFQDERSAHLAAELWSFLALRGDTNAKRELARLRREPFLSTLSLDVSMFSALTNQCLD